MIIKMSNHYKAELTNFLCQHNCLKDYFIAWIPETKTEIEAMNSDSFYLCIENDNIVGCIGLYLSIEQKVARLLGPIIEENYFDRYIDPLYQQCLSQLPESISEVKVAFYEENALCRQWCERMSYELYNAEKTMVFDKKSFMPTQLISKIASEVTIIPYESRYKNSLEKVHPKGVFFTLEELVAEVSEHHHLLLAVVQDEAVGYIYFEETADKEQGDIVLFHVKPDARGKGFGTGLILKALEYLIDHQVKEIVLNVRADNHDAQKLYQRIGFIEKDTILAYRKPI
jgi:GNAT superfamily N-acetyltransferase